MKKQFKPYAYVNVPKSECKEGYKKIFFDTYQKFKSEVKDLLYEYNELTLHRTTRNADHTIQGGVKIEYWSLVNNEPIITKTIDQ